jgi:hypothetical protein
MALHVVSVPKEIPVMALDRKELDQILSTLHKYAEKKLTPEFLLKLDHEDRFPTEVLSDLYNNIGLHLVFIGEDDEGLGGGAYDVYRVSEAMAGYRRGHCHRRARHLPRRRPHRGGRHAEEQKAPLDGSHRRLKGCSSPTAPRNRQAGSDLALAQDQGRAGA